MHFSLASKEGMAILNTRYELQSKSGAKFEKHTTFEPESVSPASGYGICKLEQLMLWKDGGVTVTRGSGGKPMRVRIIGIDPNRVHNFHSLLFPFVFDF